MFDKPEKSITPHYMHCFQKMRLLRYKLLLKFRINPNSSHCATIEKKNMYKNPNHKLSTKHFCHMFTFRTCLTLLSCMFISKPSYREKTHKDSHKQNKPKTCLLYKTKWIYCISLSLLLFETRKTEKKKMKSVSHIWYFFFRYSFSGILNEVFFGICLFIV